MKLAFNQASKVLGNTGQNPAVGCVIVKRNNVISLGHTNYSGRPHAEYNALSNKKLSYDDSILYSTLEPCSHYGKTQPCTNIIKRKNVKTVIFSQLDPDIRSYNRAKKFLNSKKIKTFSNICDKDGKSFYKDYFIKKKTNKIFISSKLATSKDYFIKNKYNKYITNIYSRGRAHLLRSSHDSILTTSKTVLSDNPTLNCRIQGLEKYSPSRFILDKNLSIKSSAKIFNNNRYKKTYVFYNVVNQNKLRKLKALKVITIKISLKNNLMDFNEVIHQIKRLGYSRLFIEAGIEFNNFLLKNNYIDEFYHFYSDIYFKKNGFFNAKLLINKINRCMKNKRKIKTNLFNDNLIKYFVK